MARRVDELKMFLGSLCPSINKPKILNLLAEMGMEPWDVIAPMVQPGKLAIAFVIFNTPSECEQAIGLLHGATDIRFSPGAMQAHRGDPPGGVFISCYR